MRFRNGISLDEWPDFGSLKTPGLSRRFLFVDDPDRASGADSLVVVGKNSRLEVRASLRAGLILAEDGVDGFPEDIPVARIRAARGTIASLLRTFADRLERPAPPWWTGQPVASKPAEPNAIHPTAVVEGELEGGVTVGAHAFVGAGVYVGRGTVIQPGAVIGCAGFGFFESHSPAGLEAMPHEAGVLIGRDCFIGANTVIAAGVLHPTELGDGCKLDSHVQIAHNVRLGAGALMASQAGIAGSTVVGAGLRMGGAASVSGHLRLGRGVSIAAKSGVTKDIPDGMTVAGFPARPIGEWRKAMNRMMNAE